MIHIVFDICVFGGTGMKKLFLTLLAVLGVAAKPALANPACAVCTVAIGASLEIARKLGVDDNIVGLWAGALLALLGYWLILWFDKKKWHFRGRDALLMAVSVGSIGFMYVRDLMYVPQPVLFVLYLDPFLFWTLAGALLFIYTEKLYFRMKARNGGHAHFPFEKVVMPVAVLALVSVALNYYPDLLLF